MTRLWWLMVNGPRIERAIVAGLVVLALGAIAAGAFYLGAAGASGEPAPHATSAGGGS